MIQQAVHASMPPVISTFEDSAVVTAARLLLSGKVIAMPTDTVYGLAVSTQNNNGIRKLYEIKKRDKDKPIAICVSNTEEIHLWAESSHLQKTLLDLLLPGAVTIVLKRKSLLNPLLNPDTSLIGIRIPKHNFVQNLSRSCGVPLALTSANVSSEPSSLQVTEFQNLWTQLGGVFDGGILGKSSSLNRAGSTVVDLSEPGYYRIIRSGSALENTINILKKFDLKEK